MIQADGVKMDKATNQGLLHIMNCNTSVVLSVTEKFQSLFWQQQMKAKENKAYVGIQLSLDGAYTYLYHHSSGAYSTLHNSRVLKLLSERTLRDYRHFASAAVGFTKDNDQQLVDLFQLQNPVICSCYFG